LAICRRTPKRYRTVFFLKKMPVDYSDAFSATHSDAFGATYSDAFGATLLGCFFSN